MRITHSPTGGAVSYSVSSVSLVTYSILQVVNEPGLVQETLVLGLLIGVFNYKAQSTRDGLVDDLDGQVLPCFQVNTPVHISVVTLAQDLTLEEFVLVGYDLRLLEPVLLGLCNIHIHMRELG